MKFYLIVLMTAVFMTGTASAQHVNIGIKGGLNVYNIDNDNGTRYNPIVGFHAGLLAHIHIMKHFGIQPEVVFSTQGTQYTGPNTKTRLNLNYINVPLLFQLMFGQGFRLQAGPQVGFLINAKSKVNNNYSDYKNNMETIDFGVTAGASYVHMKSGFGVDGRYNFGLSDINRYGTVHSYNRGFQLGVFYLFNHKS